MIVASEHKRDIGKIYTAHITDTNGKYFDMRLLVIKEST
jgi:hypothetical protein